MSIENDLINTVSLITWSVSMDPKDRAIMRLTCSIDGHGVRVICMFIYDNGRVRVGLYLLLSIIWYSPPI